MALTDKYQKLTDTAKQQKVANLSAREQDGVLYVSGKAPSEAVKQRLWDIHGEIDPDMRAGDLVLNIEVDAGSAPKPETGAETSYTVQKGDSLSKIAKNYPGLTWQKIFEANKDQIKNPDLIHPGQKLKIPSK